ncbi:monovalent cation/H+ antiporter subunit D [Nitrincola alkalilacustris]|uniref:monovalent cation/H+ antiporter subunit D n=1 Tax=Nitrincola alkalilacustris TaxID=1571224 RepID=UPI00124D22EA|nr:monovalent cation/H+ antiporter subunit D [Nitrincola alkalilacustris]
MNHLMAMPVLVPLVAGACLLITFKAPLMTQRLISLGSCSLLALLGIWAVLQAGQHPHTLYYLGNWAPPYGIVLVLDRLSAIMLLLTACLSLIAGLYACRGTDREGAHFHALFQLQLAGINGAFLTGDLFNLFVFFEILLIASYALLLHGGGRARSRAGLHYVIINLVGSALFLFAVGTLYGLTGTLNMADLAVKIALIPAEDQPLLTSAALLLLVVFGVKAALLPLLFWLPRAYSAASAPVAALFAIMTKVGIYAMLRVFHLVFSQGEQPINLTLWEWLWPLSLATLLLGAVGVLGSASLRTMTAYLVIVSVGILLAAISLPGQEMLSSALYYLLHSTCLTATFFLLADLIGKQRYRGYDRFSLVSPLNHRWLLGCLFFIAAISISGLPPFSGFISKLWLIQSAIKAPSGGLLWGLMLLTGLLTLIALSRAGSRWFWRPTTSVSSPLRLDKTSFVLICLMLTTSLVLSLLAEPIIHYLERTAEQILSPDEYIHAVLQSAWLSEAEVVP